MIHPRAHFPRAKALTAQAPSPRLRPTGGAPKPRLPVKLDESGGHPHNFSSYFYFFAYAHAASAIAFHGESAAEKLRLLRSDLLRVVELDGTWVDFEMIGKPYGTAMALYVLHLARQGVTR